jgi:rSAM/selenodomain-associated transferase 1
MPAALAGRVTPASGAPAAMSATRAGGRVLARPSTSLAPRILIPGGGFAGVTAALELAKRCAGLLPVHITLVSNQNFFLFTPMLAEAATGAVETRHILYPIRPLCGRRGASSRGGSRAGSAATTRSAGPALAWHDGAMASAERAVGLAIMAKAPRVGAVKTRLCPPLRAAEAAELARCFLLDAVERVRAVAGARPILAYSPAEARSDFERMGPDFVLISQQGCDVGERQGRLLEEILALGHEAAIVIGTDSPTLPRECLDEAVGLVMSPDVDLVLGPCEDGGYYLIGLRAPWPALFEDMPWSTSGVLSRTLDRALGLGLRVACLPTWFDVDTGIDLDRLRADLGAAPGPLPRHTREFLARRIFPAGEVVKPANHEKDQSDGGGTAAPRGR